MASARTPRPLRFARRADWRAWLEANHARSEGVWLLFEKVKTGSGALRQREAVEEALCFGWIDSQARGRDERTYVQRFTPRRPRSVWSAINKRRVERLIAEGAMRPAGLRAIERARLDGSWSVLDAVEAGAELPPELRAELARSPRAAVAFSALSPSTRKAFHYFVSGPKTEATRSRRAALAAFMLEEGLRFDTQTRIADLEARMRRERGRR